MDEDLKKALAELGVNTVAEAGKKVSEAINEFRSEHEANLKSRDAVTEEKLARIETELNKFEEINALITKAEEKAKADKDELQESLDRIEARLQRPGADGGEADAEAKAYREAFFDFTRHDKEAFTGDRKNVLQVSDDSSAGYLAPTEFVHEILKEIVEVSPMRGLVRVRQTGHRAIQIPKRSARPSAQWVGEVEERPTSSDLAYEMLDIPVFESTLKVPVSNQMLEDAEFNIEDEIREAVAEGYGEQEGQAIISGTGSKRPEGILVASGTKAHNSGSATGLTGDGVIQLKYQVKTGYARNGSYILNRNTLGKIRILKDGNGQYIWQAGLADGRPNAIDGSPYTEMPDMPDVQAGAKALAFGDWRRGYMLVDRLQMAMLRDPFTLAGNGQVLFRWRRRVGGAVTIAEAIAVQTIAA